MDVKNCKSPTIEYAVNLRLQGVQPDITPVFFAIAQKATALENCRCKHLLPRRCKVDI